MIRVRGRCLLPYSDLNFTVFASTIERHHQLAGPTGITGRGFFVAITVTEGELACLARGWTLT